MKYTDINCEACGVPFTDADDTVVCPVCGAPHHRACWNEAGHCAHEAAHAEGYVWTAPATAQSEQPEPPRRELQSSDGDEPLENGEEIVLCPRCGARNFGNDAYCLSCGQPLHDRTHPGADGFQTDTAQTDDGRRRMSEEMLQSFRRFGGLHPDAPLDGIPVCEYADFVGGGSPGKLLRKISLMERYGKKVSFLLSAFVFGPIWLFYRKMKKEGWVVGMALILLCLFSGLLQINDAYVAYTKQSFQLIQDAATGNLTRQELLEQIESSAIDFANAPLSKTDRLKRAVSQTLYYAAQLGVPLYCGLFGLQLYRKKTKADILRIRQECTDMHGYREQLLAEGGTSAAGAVIGVLVVGVALVCYAYVPVLLALLYY